MKRLIAIIILSVIIIVLLSILLKSCKDNAILESNFIAERVEKENQRELDRKIFNNIYDSITVLSEKLKLKPKQIIQYLEAPVHYKDTGSTRIINSGKDTLRIYPDSLYATIKRSCYDLDILFYKGQLNHTLRYHDSIYAVIYRERPKKLFFIKYGKWKFKGLIYSSCNDSAYQVIDNIKVNR